MHISSRSLFLHIVEKGDVHFLKTLSRLGFFNVFNTLKPLIGLSLTTRKGTREVLFTDDLSLQRHNSKRDEVIINTLNSWQLCYANSKTFFKRLRVEGTKKLYKTLKSIQPLRAIT